MLIFHTFNSGLSPSKWLDWKDKVNFKIYETSGLLTNNYNANVTQYPTKQRQSDQLIEYNKINIFIQKLCRVWGKEISSKPLFVF